MSLKSGNFDEFWLRGLLATTPLPLVAFRVLLADPPSPLTGYVASGWSQRKNRITKGKIALNKIKNVPRDTVITVINTDFRKIVRGPLRGHVLNLCDFIYLFHRGIFTHSFLHLYLIKIAVLKKV